MAITFQHSNGTSIHFENPNFLIDQVNKDALFQKRIKIIVIVALAILWIGGAMTCGLGFAVIIPYGLMHTVLVGTGAATATLSNMALSVVALEPGDEIIAYCTSLPVCRKLLQSRIISDEKSWTYLQKCHEEYQAKCREVARTTLDTAFGEKYSFKGVQDLIEAY